MLFLSGFCHFSLVYSWFCDGALTLPSCLVFCCLVSRLRTLFHVGAWCSDPGTPVLFRLSSGFRVGVRTLTQARSGRALLCPCALCLVRHAVRVRPCDFSLSFVARSSFSGCVLSLVLFCSVWYAACVFHWLRAFMFVMFCVNTRLMSLLISCVFVSCFAHG